MEKDALQGLVAKVTTSPDELAKLIAKANEPKQIPATSTTGNNSTSAIFGSSQLRQGAERMSQMTPDQLRQQAATMRAMGTAALRATNPAMSQLTDDQINMSISQMEAMANNPQMMKMAMDQMKNMTESDLNEAMKQNPLTSPPSSSSNNNNPTYADVRSAAAASSFRSSAVPDAVKNMSSDQFKTASQQMASMSPDQLKQQAQMLRGMSKDTLRRSNPYMANMSDSEIDIAIQQMEVMASNPEMLKMAGEQIKNMSPDQFEQMKSMVNGGVGFGGGSVMMGGSSGNNANSTAATAAGGFPTDPSQMMESLLSNPDQLNSIVKMMKQNPDMMKQMIASQFGGGSGGEKDKAKIEHMEKAIDQFAQMDDKQLERYLKVANTVQTVAKPLLNSFKSTKNALGVSSKTLIILINVVFSVGFYILYKWLKTRSVEEIPLVDPLAQEMPPEIIIDGADEF